MFLVPIILSWAKGFTLRQWIEVGATVAIIVFVLYWDHLEIQKGRDETEARYAAVSAKAQAAIDKAAAVENENMHLKLDKTIEPLPGYLKTYGDKTRMSDCPSVAYTRKAQP